MLFAEAGSQPAAWEVPWYWAALAGAAVPLVMGNIIRIVWTVEWYVREVGRTTKQTANWSGVVAGLFTGTLLGVSAVAVTGLLCSWMHGPELPCELLGRGALAGLLIGLLSVTFWYVESKPAPITPPSTD